MFEHEFCAIATTSEIGNVSFFLKIGWKRKGMKGSLEMLVKSVSHRGANFGFKRNSIVFKKVSISMFLDSSLKPMIWRYSVPYKLDHLIVDLPKRRKKTKERLICCSQDSTNIGREMMLKRMMLQKKCTVIYLFIQNLEDKNSLQSWNLEISMIFSIVLQNSWKKCWIMETEIWFRCFSKKELKVEIGNSLII